MLDAMPAADWLRDRRQPLIARALDALAEQPPTGAPDPTRVHDAELRWIIGYNLDLFVRTLETDRPDFDEEDAPDLVASAARRASDGSAVEELLHDYQVGISAMWRAAVDLAGPDGSDLVDLTSAMQAYLLRATTLVLRGFQHEASRISLGERDARFALYSALLSGDDPQVAAQRSGLGLASAYLVLRLQLGPDPETNPSAILGRAVQVSEHRRANTVQRILSTHADGDVLALVRDPVGTALVPVDLSPTDEGQTRARLMIDSLAESLGSAVHAAAAVVAPEDVPVAAALTDDVLELVVATAREPGVYFLEDVLVPYQLTRPGPARTLLEERLRPLDLHPEWEATLHAYVRSGFDRRATATQLHLHPNSVDYRLGRIATLCGFDPAQPAERATAFAAICIRDLARHRAEASPSA